MAGGCVTERNHQAAHVVLNLFSKGLTYRVDTGLVVPVVFLAEIVTKPIL